MTLDTEENKEEMFFSSMTKLLAPPENLPTEKKSI